MQTVVRLAVLIAACASMAAASVHAQSVVLRGAEVTRAVSTAHLPSLRGAMAQTEGTGAEHRVRELRIPLVDSPGQASDPVVQSHAGTSAATVSGIGFDGIGVGLGSFADQYAPPDTTGAVGATQYVQWVNASFAVFDKTSGAVVYGPVAGNTLFQGLGGACAANNDGDPVVQYDKLANRWVLSQFSVTNGSSSGYWQCVAVSQTSDATGAWNTYAFPQPLFNDYPKMGVWSDGYYVTFNMFNGNTFQGARVCAMDRASMLQGLPATQQCFQLSSSYASLLPADIDGTTAPPAGAPNYLVNRLSTALGLWRFHTDWGTPANSTLAGPTTLTVAAYNAACGGGTCVPQPGTSQKLDSLADRLMFRLAYRVVNGVERMVVNHAVMVNKTRKSNSGNAAIRWYEIRGMGGTPSIYQQSSYSPDTTFRWMGSVAQDKQGNMAVGYSTSSGSLYPSLAYATRLATDAAGTLGAESTIVSGAGSQLPNLSRWGDYTHMSVDPVDDCTFWYTGQYLKSSGTFNWSTRIASFKIQGCQ